MTSAIKKTAETMAPEHDQPLDVEALVRAGQEMALDTLRAEMVALSTVMSNLTEPHGHVPLTPEQERAAQDAVEQDFDNLPI